MKINDTSVTLRTIRFGCGGRESVWNRAHGSVIWTKYGTGATKSSAQMATALRHFATQNRYVLEFSRPLPGTARVTEREGYVAPQRAWASLNLYRCAGCGTTVARKRRAKEGEPVWCGGRRCKNTFTVRLGDKDKTIEDIGYLLDMVPIAIDLPIPQ